MRSLFDKINWKKLTEDKRLKINIGLAVVLIILFLFCIDILFSFYKYRGIPQQEERPKAEIKSEKGPAHLPTVQKQPRMPGAKIAIILDDAGGSSVNYSKIFSINQRITLAILPHLGTSAKFAKEAHDAGLEIILHMPMEPENSIYVRHDGGMILCSQSDEEIKRMVEGDLGSFSFAAGINNHEGSK